MNAFNQKTEIIKLEQKKHNTFCLQETHFRFKDKQKENKCIEKEDIMQI